MSERDELTNEIELLIAAVSGKDYRGPQAVAIATLALAWMRERQARDEDVVTAVWKRARRTLKDRAGDDTSEMGLNIAEDLASEGLLCSQVSPEYEALYAAAKRVIRNNDYQYPGPYAAIRNALAAIDARKERPVIELKGQSWSYENRAGAPNPAETAPGMYDDDYEDDYESEPVNESDSEGGYR
jgi:hypothetical protein